MSTLRERLEGLVAKWREYGERSIMQEAYTALGEARGYRNCATELEAVAEGRLNDNAKEELDAIDELCGPRQPDDATSVFCRISHKLRAAAPSLHKEPRNMDYLADLRHDLQDEEFALAYLSACAKEGDDTLRIGIRDVRAALHKEGAGGAPQVSVSMREWLKAQRVTLDERQLWAVESYLVMNVLPVQSEATADLESLARKIYDAVLAHEHGDSGGPRLCDYHAEGERTAIEVLIPFLMRVASPAGRAEQP